MILRREYIFINKECNLKYLFIKKKRSNRMMIIFSGFPAKDQKSVYNYVLKFRDLRCNKLYILDDFGSDSRGSYYLGKNKNFFIERAVTQLIEKISNENKIPKENIMTVGSSKGGFAALYFAFKNGYGATISGAPQILLGNYLSLPIHLDILNYITGGIDENEVECLNKILLNLIYSSTVCPDLYLHVSEKEHHYEGHILHLLKALDSKNFKYNLDLADYEIHGEVSKYFPEYARKSFQDLTSKSQ